MKKEREKLKEYRGLKEKVEKMWEVKVETVASAVIQGCDPVTGRVTQTHPINNIRNLCPRECCPCRK